MSPESTSNPNITKSPLTPLSVIEDYENWYDRPITLTDPQTGNQSHFEVYDVVVNHRGDGTRVPEATLKQPDGSMLVMDIQEMLDRRVPDEDEVTEAPTDKLQTAKQIWSETDPMQQFIGDDKVEAAQDELSNDDKKAFEAWQIEQAATKSRSLHDILQEAPKYGNSIPKVAKEHIQELQASLEAMGARGVFTDKPSEEMVAAGIKHARDLIASGQSDAVMRSMPFVGHTRRRNTYESATSKQMIWLDEPLYINPEAIVSAEGFESWLGRGHNGNGEVGIREGRGTRRSKDQILDYATRDTQLPVLNADGGVSIIMSDKGVQVFSDNAHRAAAAKLRNEPIGVTSINVYRI